MDHLDAAALRAALAGVPLGRVELVDEVGSTSTALIDAAAADPGAWPDRSVLVAEHQQAGRGRAGRTWTTPRGVALTASVLLRPEVDPARWGWVPLLAGLAVARAVRGLGAPAVLKWPNDVLLPADPPEPGWGRYRKLAGVLAELRSGPEGPSVVVGVGVNVAQRWDQLPVPSATSLALAGVEVSRQDLLVALLARWVELDAAWRSSGGDGAMLADAWLALSVTIGQHVVVDLPGGGRVEGAAVGLDTGGALLVRGTDGTTAVHAGDVRVRVSGAGSGD
ncbi:biotin--[acetyl-CoA-carboxylase] ligase [Isoptericola sp. b441]|uniref:biotin--[biotin carboxyl-carrier protein] ligase n=1 Tax=Actinotalea lenta TaxID=3064654 RepID=A0ABT9D8P8_9CELL|nr:biotin--[acetyl-CoA-carboxylase] ligase [Isoptericola sp. b441]MDO8106930.1 biotin--[acetyl-CoA-carboxylase] ligase [Isoptericola sp. b441]